MTRSVFDPRARKYLPLPFACDLVSYGSNIVAQTAPELEEVVWEYLRRYPVAHCMETPHLQALDKMLAPFGLQVCFMAEYFLPQLDKLCMQECRYELRLLGPEEFASLYLPEWSNALFNDRKNLDVLGVGAYDNGRLVGLAGCSADAEEMWQIGVDVLPEYRRNGIASAITARLAMEIIDRGKVPFYCSAWSNIRSVKNAIKSGFIPAWVEMTAKPISIVDEMNE